MTIYICIVCWLQLRTLYVVQIIGGVKLLQLDHLMSIHGKTFVVASDSSLSLSLHHKIYRKTFIVYLKTAPSNMFCTIKYSLCNCSQLGIIHFVIASIES